ncbi:MAG: NAD+ synthase [Proteobacteria bacterium]|nr:NAD+ synthase [Pseudomonadota bacterium]
MTAVFFVQQNFTVGDLRGNAKQIITAAHAALAAGADVALTPELALTGYMPEDLLYSPAFRRQTEDTALYLAAALPPALAVVVGLPLWQDGVLYNGCALMRGGKIEATYCKAHLPNYSVFDEKRYFSEHPNPPLVFIAGSKRYAIQICQDLWVEQQHTALATSNLDAILVANGSPFVPEKQLLRQQMAATCARHAKAAVFYSNSVGGQDELVFDGASFVVDKEGNLSGQLPAFIASNAYADSITPYPAATCALYQALCVGLANYACKNHFKHGVLLGLSGGVDSALVAALASAALGKSQVQAVMMPTEYTSTASLEDAATLAGNLEIDYLTLPIQSLVTTFNNTVQPHLLARNNDVTLENIQARLRGTLLMALSNNRDLLLLATGNKSEFLCGYSTLYGDMNGGFAPIKDVLKTQVWELCRYINNTVADVIPERIISRAPSAELRHEQTDQQSLPPYEQLDAIIRDHLADTPLEQMAATHEAAALANFYQRLATSEHKRRQAPPGTKVSERGLGKDWRYPLSNHFSYV